LPGFTPRRGVYLFYTRAENSLVRKISAKALSISFASDPSLSLSLSLSPSFRQWNIFLYIAVYFGRTDNGPRGGSETRREELAPRRYRRDVHYQRGINYPSGRDM